MRVVAKGRLGEAPEWRPITSLSDVDVLIREVLLRLSLGDLTQERMDQFVPMVKQAERVRELAPWQRDFLAATNMLFVAQGLEEIAAAERKFAAAMEGIK